MQRNRPSKFLLGAAMVLCVYGLYEAVNAAMTVFGTPRGPFAALFDYPTWGLTHFVPGALFMTIGPLQLWPAFRNRHRTLHRWSGRVMVAASTFLGFSGAALVLLMPERTLGERIFMLSFATVFLFFLVKAFAAARRRDFTQHRIWMIRMFCTGLTITTQRLWLLVFIIAFGIPDTAGFWRYFVSAGWLAWIIQVSIAEWWVARGTVRKTVPAPAYAAVRE